MRQPMLVRASSIPQTKTLKTAEPPKNPFKQYALEVLMDLTTSRQYFKPQKTFPALPPEPVIRDTFVEDASGRRLLDVVMQVAPVTIYDGSTPLQMMVVPNPYTKSIRLQPVNDAPPPPPVTLPGDEVHAVSVHAIHIAPTDPRALLLPHLFPPATRLVPDRKLYTLTVDHLKSLAMSLTTKLRALTTELTSSPRPPSSSPSSFNSPSSRPPPQKPPSSVTMQDLLNLDNIQAIFSPKPPPTPTPSPKNPPAPPAVRVPKLIDATATALALHDLASLSHSLLAMDPTRPSGYSPTYPPSTAPSTPSASAAVSAAAAADQEMFTVDLEELGAMLQEDKTLLSPEGSAALVEAFRELAEVSRQLARQARADELTMAGYFGEQ